MVEYCRRYSRKCNRTCSFSPTVFSNCCKTTQSRRTTRCRGRQQSSVRRNCYGHSVTTFRQKFWIPTAHQSAKPVLRGCFNCRKVIGKPYQAPILMLRVHKRRCTFACLLLRCQQQHVWKLSPIRRKIRFSKHFAVLSVENSCQAK